MKCRRLTRYLTVERQVLFIDRAWLRQKENYYTTIGNILLKSTILTEVLIEEGASPEEVSLILSYQGHKEHAVFEVCDLGKSNLIISYTWLHKHNPEIDWETGKSGNDEMVHESCNVSGRRQKGMKKRKKRSR